MKYAGGMVDQVKGSGSEKNNSRGTDFQNHWFAWADTCSALFMDCYGCYASTKNYTR